VFVRIEASSGVPIWRQIADQIRAQCATKTLKPGDRLPSVRVLARELAVNQNTILRVYERLTMEGILDMRHGDGTYVAQRVPSDQLETRQLDLLREQVGRLVYKAVTLNVPAKEVHKIVDETFGRIDGPPKPSKGKGNE
jgi:GntR family transcriptional regulator